MLSLAALTGAACSSSTGKTVAPTTAPAGSVSATTTSVPPTPLRSSLVAVPTITGPVSGGQPDLPVNAMLASAATQYGYTEHEYFMAGTASAFAPTGAWGEDGHWAATPTTTASYKTRILVRTPADPTKFNGTVVVEWLNESSGRDSDPDFGFAYPELLRDGFAYVGVSAQAQGVIGGGSKIPIPGYNPKPLVQQNPARYSTLHHPGDDYSYDIFSQAGQAVRRPAGVDVLGGLHPRRVIADGESQSAFRMVTYVNAVAPVANVFDGYLIHSRAASATPLNSTAAVPKVAHIRDDLPAKVMQVETETDLFGLGFYPARQADTDKLRTWEMAGTAHADQSTLDYGITSGRQWDTTDAVPDFTALCGRINDGPQRYILRKAMAALNAWLTTGQAPATGALIQVSGGADIARDPRGNALGGIRTPAVDVPISTIQGTFDTHKSVICSLFGSSAPFPPATLAALYPTHTGYVAKVQAAAASAVTAGFLQGADAQLIVDEAGAAPIPR